MEFILEESSKEDMIHDINSVLHYINNELWFIIKKWDYVFIKKHTAWSEEEANIIDAFSKIATDIRDQLNIAGKAAELIDRCNKSHDFRSFYNFQKELHSRLKDPFSVIETLSKYEPDKSSSSDEYHDSSISKKISDVITAIFNALLDMKTDNTLNLLEDDMIKLIRSKITKQEYWFKENYNFKRVHPFSSYLHLKQYCDFINPNFDQISWENEDFFGRMLHKEIVDEIAYYREYENKNKDQFQIDKFEKIYDNLKYHLKRLVRGIIQELNRPILINQVLERYNLRTVLYNTSHLKELLKSSKNKERMLTRDLCNFVFDQGYTPINEFHLNVGRIDVADFTGPNPFLLEVKVMKEGFSKHDFMSAIRQLLLYTTSLEKSFNVDRGYLVFFRLGGPLVSIPGVVRIHNIEIYFKIIDISGEIPSDQQLNKALKKFQISEQDIHSEFEIEN